MQLAILAPNAALPLRPLPVLPQARLTPEPRLVALSCRLHTVKSDIFAAQNNSYELRIDQATEKYPM
jgi:hypothetical protein